MCSTPFDIPPIDNAVTVRQLHTMQFCINVRTVQLKCCMFTVFESKKCWNGGLDQCHFVFCSWNALMLQYRTRNKLKIHEKYNRIAFRYLVDWEIWMRLSWYEYLINNCSNHHTQFLIIYVHDWLRLHLIIYDERLYRCICTFYILDIIVLISSIERVMIVK